MIKLREQGLMLGNRNELFVYMVSQCLLSQSIDCSNGTADVVFSLKDFIKGWFPLQEVKPTPKVCVKAVFSFYQWADSPICKIQDDWPCKMVMGGIIVVSGGVARCHPGCTCQVQKYSDMIFTYMIWKRHDSNNFWWSLCSHWPMLPSPSVGLPIG